MFVLIKGLIIGMIIAAPLGPTGILWLQRMISVGRRYGLSSALGSAVADSFYAGVVLYGISFVSDFIFKHRIIFEFLIGIFFLLLGVRSFFRGLTVYRKRVEEVKISRSFLTGAIITFMAPQIIVLYTGLYVVFDIKGLIDHPFEAGAFIFSVFLGSASFWVLSAFLYGFIKDKVKENEVILINKIVGVLLTAFGLAAIIKVIFFKHIYSIF